MLRKGLLRRGQPLHVIYDGSSLVSGTGASTGNTFPDVCTRLLRLTFSDVTYANVGVGGQTWRQMDGLDGGSSADVDNAYNPRRQNVLVAGEMSNTIVAGRTPAQNLSDTATYIANRKAAMPGLVVLLWNSIPRQTGGTTATTNASLETANALVASKYRSIGAHGLVDFRMVGSPWRFSAYNSANFDADPQLWYEALGSRVHATDAGYAIMAGMIQRGVLALPNQ